MLTLHTRLFLLLPLWPKSHRGFKMGFKSKILSPIFSQIWWRWNLFILMKASFQNKSTPSAYLKNKNSCFTEHAFIKFLNCLVYTTHNRNASYKFNSSGNINKILIWISSKACKISNRKKGIMYSKPLLYHRLWKAANNAMFFVFK